MREQGSPGLGRAALPPEGAGCMAGNLPVSWSKQFAPRSAVITAKEIDENS